MKKVVKQVSAQKINPLTQVIYSELTPSLKIQEVGKKYFSFETQTFGIMGSVI